MSGSTAITSRTVVTTTRKPTSGPVRLFMDYAAELGLVSGGLLGVILLILSVASEGAHGPAQHAAFCAGLNVELRPIYAVHPGRVPEEILLHGRGGRLLRWQHDRAIPTAFPVVKDEGLLCVHYDADSGLYFAGFHRGEVVVWRHDGSDECRMLQVFDDQTPVAVAYHAKARILAVAGSNGGIAYGPLDTPTENWIFHDLDSSATALKIHGDRLFVTTFAGHLQVYDVVRQETHWSCMTPSTSTVTLAISPDGRLVATAHNRGVLRLWDVETKRQVAQTHVDSLHALTLAFTPDGTQLVSGGFDKQVRFWSVPDLKPAGHGPIHPGPVRSIVISADGRDLFSGSLDGSVIKWSIPEKKIVNAVAIPFAEEESLRSLNEHPDLDLNGSRRSFETL